MRALIIALGLALATAPVAAAQNGLYSPATIPTSNMAGPMATGGLLMARDSIFHLDSIAVRQVAPSSAYNAVWQHFEACSGLTLDRAAWTVSLAPGDGFIVPGGKAPVPGYAFVEKQNIVILAKYAVQPGRSPESHKLLGHEMVHALIWTDRQAIGHNERGDMPEFERCDVGNQ